MKSKNLKRSLSLVLIFLLTFSTNVFASSVVDEIMCIDDMEYEESEIMDVILPTNPIIELDPLQVKEKGQIISDNINIINYSNVDVEIELKSIYYILNDKTIIPMSEPFDNSSTTEKKMYLFLRKAEKSSIISEETVFLESEIASLDDIVVGEEIKENVSSYILKSANYTEKGKFISLSEDSVISFKYFGIISTYPDKSWAKNDVTVRLVFELKAVSENDDEESNTEEDLEDILGPGIVGTTENDEDSSEGTTGDILGLGIVGTTEENNTEDIESSSEEIIEENSTEDIEDSNEEIIEGNSTEDIEASSEGTTDENSIEDMEGNSEEITEENNTEDMEGSSEETTEENNTEDIEGSSEEITEESNTEDIEGSSEEITEESNTEDILEIGTLKIMEEGRVKEETIDEETIIEINNSENELFYKDFMLQDSILSDEILEKLENYKNILLD